MTHLQNSRPGTSLLVGVFIVGTLSIQTASAQAPEQTSDLSLSPQVGETIVPPFAVAPFDARSAKQFQQQWAKHLHTDPVIENSIGMKLTLIPPGEFMMGSKLSAEEVGKHYGFEAELATQLYGGQHPRHRVRITKPYFVSVHEVTVGQFRQFVDAENYRTEAERDREGGFGYYAEENKLEGRDPKYNWQHTGFPQDDKHPVVNVTFNDAQRFVKWLSRKTNATYRLLTEAEWEYACRAGTETLFHTGDSDADLVRAGNVADETVAKARWGVNFPPFACVNQSDGHKFTAPVGQFRPNAFGLYDMHGNVSEWCADWYESGYYETSPLSDPTGPASEQENRVLRGGSWGDFAFHCLSAHRLWGTRGFRSFNAGFRVARVPE